ncbi:MULTISPECIES: hypothetical protein [unclassified Microcoleus]|uniref:hypothetical protein n=1 Tax=unclassified Microcoleus TaxID=2642155 RepID=UPI002FD06E08
MRYVFHPAALTQYDRQFSNRCLRYPDGKPRLRLRLYKLDWWVEGRSHSTYRYIIINTVNGEANAF